ncbi:MAG: hypothetical protein GC159_18200 [Phycisphaera sp.]|nr:hypothetical protein [Phycisphaera sp.]
MRASRAFVFAVTALVLTTAGAASAQKLELDVEAFLSNQRTLTNTYMGPVWLVKVQRDRQLILVPLKPVNIDKPLELTERAVEVSGSRLVGWYIPQEGLDWQSALSNQKNPDNQVSVGKQTLDTSIPRISRDVILKPDGTVEWKMARAMLNATPNRSAYGLRIDRSMIKRPTQPKISSRGNNETASQYAVRRNATLTKFRDELQTYNAINKLLSGLPSEFSQPMPGQIWAIFDGSVLIKDIVIDGAETSPWTISYQTFKTTQKLISGGGTNVEIERALSELAASDSPQSLHAAAMVIASGSNLSKLSPDSPAVPLIQRVMAKGDTKSKVLVASAIARDPASAPIASSLLDSALTNPDPQVVLLGLKGKLSEQKGAAPDPATLATLTQTANSLLASPTGPPSAEVLQVCVDLVNAQPSTLETLATKVQVASTNPRRLDTTISYIVKLAGRRERLTTEWLSHQLLDPANADLASRTTQTMVAIREAYADVDAENKEPTFTYALNSESHGLLKMLASPDAPIRSMALQVIPAFRVATAQAVAETQVPIIYAQLVKAALAIKPTPRAIVEMMIAANDASHTAGPLGKIAAGGEGPGQAAAIAALRQSGPNTLEAAMNAMNGDEQASMIAAWYEMADAADTPTAKPLPGFTGLAAHLIKQWTMNSAAGGADTGPPAVIDVLRGDDKTIVAPVIVPWLAKEIAAGHRPHPQLWYETIHDEGKLAVAAGSKDLEVANGGRAILIASVAWPEQQYLVTFNQRFATEAAADPTVQATNVWSAMRTELSTEALAKMPGVYHATLAFIPGASLSKTGANTPTEPADYDLGQVVIEAGASTREFAIKDLGVTVKVTDPIIKLVATGGFDKLADALKPKPVVFFPKTALTFRPERNHGWLTAYGDDGGATYRLRLERVGDAPSN